MQLFKEYGWTCGQVDELPLDYMLSIVVLRDKLENAPVLANPEDIFR